MNDVTSYAFVSEGTVVDGERGRIEFTLDGHWSAPDRYRFSFTVDGPDGPAAGTMTLVGGRGVGEGFDDWHGTLPFMNPTGGLPRRFGQPEVVPLADAAIVQAPADGEAAYLIVGTRSTTVRGGLGASMRLDVEMVIDRDSFLLREKKERWEFTSFVEADGGGSPEPDRTVVHDLTFGFSRFNVPVDIVLPADPDGPTPAPTPTTTPPPPPSAP